MNIPFNKPYLTGKEAHYMYQAVMAGKLSGNGEFTKRVQHYFEEHYGFRKCLLTTSCTDALEMAAILTNVGPGDEVIVPSYTFVSSALAFVRQGATIVFADSYSDNPNIDADKLESLITPHTKVIVPVHYAGVACDMDKIMEVANRHNIFVVEDAAQAVDSFYQAPSNSPLGENYHADEDVDFIFKTANPQTYEILKQYARKNRMKETDDEKLLWEVLRGKKLGVQFRRQHIIDNYIADFACIEKQLVIEIDGGYHTRSIQQEEDGVRQRNLEHLGFTVLRFTNKEVRYQLDNVIKIISDTVQNLPPRGNGKGASLGSIGHLACFSFHETKNIIAGEGGMLVINDERFIRRAEIIWEKGTNRAEFFRGEVNKYGWVDTGSSFLPSEVIAAFLWAQVEHIEQIQSKRKALWNAYYEGLKPLADKGYFALPNVPEYATNNAHMFYIVCRNLEERTSLIAHLKSKGILSVFHYLSLHSSEFYTPKHDGRELPNCDMFADCLVRLPMYYELTEEQVEEIVSEIKNWSENV